MSSKNKYKKLANLMAILHFVWIIIVLITLPLVLAFSYYKTIGIVIILINILAWLIWKECPFFIWENNFRKKFNSKSVYKKAFITHYVKKYFNIYIPTYVVRIFLYSYGIIILIISLI